VRALAKQIAEALAANGRRCLDGLINNAGAFTYWLTLTPEGFETQWAVNHLAPYLLTRLLLPLLEAAPSGRVVTVSSDSHYGPPLRWNDLQLRRRYDGLRAYHQTKLANVLFTLELNRQLAGRPSLRAFAADPGLVKTDIGLKGTPPLVAWIWQRRRAGGVSPEHSGSWVAYLASEPSIQESPELYWKEGAPRRASRQALDVEAARRLWLVSEQMCALGMEN
jgi:NAD(P)-dependent dehydrogenase (short-subunit alcohol dehydrogenase family)